LPGLATSLKRPARQDFKEQGPRGGNVSAAPARQPCKNTLGGKARIPFDGFGRRSSSALRRAFYEQSARVVFELFASTLSSTACPFLCRDTPAPPQVFRSASGGPFFFFGHRRFKCPDRRLQSGLIGGAAHGRDRCAPRRNAPDRDRRFPAAPWDVTYKSVSVPHHHLPCLPWRLKVRQTASSKGQSLRNARPFHVECRPAVIKHKVVPPSDQSSPSARPDRCLDYGHRPHSPPQSIAEASAIDRVQPTPQKPSHYANSLGTRPFPWNRPSTQRLVLQNGLPWRWTWAHSQRAAQTGQAICEFVDQRKLPRLSHRA